LIGSASKDGPTIFIGDSWGAIAAFATAHELYACCGWSPSHVLVSGNASPAVTTTHMGLGSYSSKPMRDLKDKDLVAFLKKSGVEEEDDSRLEALLPPFRADCQLYEDYARPSQLPVLPSKICVLRGKDDGVITTAEVSGWADEFDCDEPKILRVPDATHHVHEEQPAVVAEHVISFLGLKARTSLGLERTPEKVPYPRKGRTGSPTSGTLAPPCPFVRGIDAEALQSFRKGNLLYRMGSAQGSRGELSNLAVASKK
jgi:surfactin synthase thioesterase subunit